MPSPETVRLKTPRSDVKASLGLALSGGGSRAAAFHRGTVQGLSDFGLLDDIDVVSSVSGGSVFAAAWMAAVWKERRLARFIDDIGHELAKGFIRRSITLRALKLISPYYTRSNLLSETFDHTLMHGMRLKDLPMRPILCMNTSVMNTGQVGKFSRHGFSSTGIYGPDASQESSNPSIPLPEFPVALAATASAAFPVGLPPIYLRRGSHFPVGWGGPHLNDHGGLALTDGGVLENLGVQTLLKSRRFGTWDIFISDAGRKDKHWKPGGLGNYIRGALMGITSLATIERVTTMMNSKENRHMRFAAFGEMERSWLFDALRTNAPLVGLEEFLSAQPVMPRRRILFVRLNQTMSELLANIPQWRLHELAARANHPMPDSRPPLRELLRSFGVDLEMASEMYESMGGADRVAELNQLNTHFTALSVRDIGSLYAHARWQVCAVRALYWN